MSSRSWKRLLAASTAGALVAICGTLAAGAASASGTCAAPANYSAPAGDVNAKDYGAVGDGRHDDTAALNCALTAAAQAHLGLWMPAGRYEISSTIPVPGGTAISGERGKASPVIIEGTVSGITLGDTAHNYASGLSASISDIAFNNVTVGFFGAWTVAIQRTVFTRTYDDTTSGANELSLADLTSGTVTDSLFLHGAGLGAVPITTYRAGNTTISHNIIGMDLSQTSWLPSWPGYADWTYGQTTVTSKLASLKSTLGLVADQGQFRTGFYGDQVNNVTFDSNIVLGSMATQGYRDHVAYFWGTGTGSYTRNFVRGWPADASGGIKVRNGSAILVGGNTVTGTGIITYVLNNNVDLSFHDVTICNNRINVVNGTPGNIYDEIMNWMTITPSYAANNTVFGNVFNDPTHTAGVTVSSDGAWTVYSSNVYADTLQTVPVSGVPVTTGSPDAAHLNECAGLTPPVYSIP